MRFAVMRSVTGVPNVRRRVGYRSSQIAMGIRATDLKGNLARIRHRLR